MRYLSAVALVLSWSVASWPAHAAEDDVFRRAVSYIFTGKIDPEDAPAIAADDPCVVIVHDPTFNRFIRYHLSRFKMDSSTIDKIYVGAQPRHVLEVTGDDVVVEYLAPDKATVLEKFKSAHVPLPGNIDQTQRAFKIVFADRCKTDQQKNPF